MEVDEHIILSLQREVERLRAEMDQLRAAAMLRGDDGGDNGTDENNGGGSASGNEGYQQPHDVSLVPPVEADDTSIDERENDDDEDDETAGNFQIKGFAGKNKVDATELELTDSVSTDEFICRTSGGELEYRKLSASGGGGGDDGTLSPFKYNKNTGKIDNCLFYINRSLNQIYASAGYSTTGNGTYYLHLSHSGTNVSAEIVKDATETTAAGTSAFTNNDSNTYYKLWTLGANGYVFDWRKTLVVPFYEV